MIAATAVAERTRCSDICEWIKRIQTFTKAEQGYFIGFSSLDGTECPVEQALESGTASGMGFAVLIDDKVLFIREEQECGAPAAFLLRKNDKR